MSRRVMAMGLVLVLLLLPVMFGGWQKTETKAAYVLNKKVADLECRVWMSTAKGLPVGLKSSFDVTTSSWVFNATKTIRDHVNTQYLEVKAIGFSVSLSVSNSGAGAGTTLSQTSNTATFTTAKANNYYRGFNSYNNIANSGAFSTCRTINAYSKMSVYLDGQPFSNQAHTWQLDRI
ncbi:MAG: hypothetical protein FWG40_00250 [Peptococcaceae bacterium]|nr:hypothetical protein [Peptococcaceae bacterium]